MKRKTYYRETRLFYLVYLLMIIGGLVIESMNLLIAIIFALFITTIIQNESKPKKPTPP